MLGILLSLAGISAATVCDSDVILRRWDHGKTAVVVCGSRASSGWHQAAHGFWLGEDLTVILIRNDNRYVLATTDVLASIGVAAKLPRIVVTEFTNDCSGRAVPFVETAIDLRSQNPEEIAPRLLLRTRRWNTRDAEQLLTALQALKDDDTAHPEISSLLCELRNLALDNPTVGLEYFQRLKNAWWNDGGFGEEYSAYMVELERAAAVKARRKQLLP